MQGSELTFRLGSNWHNQPALLIKGYRSLIRLGPFIFPLVVNPTGSMPPALRPSTRTLFFFFSKKRVDYTQNYNKIDWHMWVYLVSRLDLIFGPPTNTWGRPKTSWVARDKNGLVWTFLFKRVESNIHHFLNGKLVINVILSSAD